MPSYFLSPVHSPVVCLNLSPQGQRASPSDLQTPRWGGGVGPEFSGARKALSVPDPLSSRMSQACGLVCAVDKTHVRVTEVTTLRYPLKM